MVIIKGAQERINRSVFEGHLQLLEPGLLAGGYHSDIVLDSSSNQQLLEPTEAI